MKKYNQFLVYWLVNFVILYLATYLLPTSFVAGNSIFSPLRSMLFTSFIWNIVIWKAEAMFKELELDLKGNTSMMMAYLALNFSALWLMSRFSFIFGFGIASYMHVLLLAVVANFAQYFAWMKVGDNKK